MLGVSPAQSAQGVASLIQRAYRCHGSSAPRRGRPRCASRSRSESRNHSVPIESLGGEFVVPATLQPPVAPLEREDLVVPDRRRAAVADSRWCRSSRGRRTGGSRRRRRAAAAARRRRARRAPIRTPRRSTPRGSAPRAATRTGGTATGARPSPRTRAQPIRPRQRDVPRTERQVRPEARGRGIRRSRNGLDRTTRMTVWARLDATCPPRHGGSPGG